MRGITYQAGRCAASLALFSFFANAQSYGVGMGYAAPKPFDAAPGQVITLFVRIGGKAPAVPVSANPPLPPSLGGFSAVLRQSFPSDPVSAPISAVSDGASCSGLAPVECTAYSMVTVQIPYELTANVQRARMPQNFARLEVDYNGAPVATFYLNPVVDSIHALTSCDAMVNLPGSCLSVVTHPDGSTVTAKNPAHAGETLTAAMVGMGMPVNNPVATGAAAPESGAPVDGVLISFDARANASPSAPDAASAAKPGLARLRARAVGIAEIAFTVPPAPSGLVACSSSVRSNVTVNIGRRASFDGVGICVDTSAQ